MSFRRSFGRFDGRGSSIFDRRHPAKECVRAALVIVPSPGLDLGSGVGDGQEPVCVQALVAKATVERFYERIVGWFARSAEIQRHAVLVRPAVERLRDELWPIVHANGLGRAADRRDPCHRLDHLLALDPLVDVDRQRFAGEGVDDRQRRPSNRASDTKSIDHMSLAASAAGCRFRLAALTLRLGFLSRRLSPSFRYSR